MASRILVLCALAQTARAYVPTGMFAPHGTRVHSVQGFAASPSLSRRQSSAASVGLRAARGAMEFSKLGDSDLVVSRCCLGTMTWGQQNTEDEGVEQLDIAFNEYGVNFLDTAEMYPVPTKAETQGATDRTVARWLKTRKREDVVLATKVAGWSDMITWLPERGGKGARVNPKQIRDSVESSLKRLGTDYIDLIQIHWPDRYVPLFGQSKWNQTMVREYTAFEEQLAEFKKLQEEGKIRYVGVSNETPLGVMKFCEMAEKLDLPKIVSIQNCYSLINRIDYEAGLQEVCLPENCNVGLLPYSPLAGGVLSGKYSQADAGDEAAAKWRLNLFTGYMARYKQSLAAEAVELYADLAKKYDMTPSEFAIAFCNSRDFVTSTIIGATSVPQLRENIGAFDKVWTPEMEEDVDQVFKKYKDPSKM